MDLTSVPLVEDAAELSIVDALGLLAVAGRSALARERGGGLDLVFVGRLHEALGRGETRLLEVRGGRPVHELQSGVLPSDPAVRSLFDSRANSQYAVWRRDGGQLEVVTRSESLASLLNSSDLFSCTGATPHFFPDPAVRVGDACPLRPACGRDPSGGVPTIRAV